MKAKKVYEFRTSGEIIKMGADEYYKKLIQKWLNEYMYNFKFELKNNILILTEINDKVIFLNKIIEFPPFFNNFESIIINGNLNLMDSKLKKLPDNLIKINGYLDLSMSDNIVELPEKLLEVKGLDISYTNIKKLPDNLTKINGNLFLNNSKIQKLPDNLKVGENLDISETTDIKKLPNNLYIYETLDIHDSNITELPDDLIVSSIFIDEDKLYYFKNKFPQYKFITN